MPNNKYQLIGKRFGKLVVIAEYGRSEHGDKLWLCKCDCGNKSIVTTSALTRTKGNAMSCGCGVGANLKTHGHSKERLYHIWKGMRTRCYNKTNDGYRNYGKRGIKLCDEWKNDYMSFRKWALLHGYSDNLTIERIDVNKGYSPDNCEWITLIEQSRNKRNTVWITYKGEKKTLKEWSAITGFGYGTLYTRIFKLKWDLKDAFSKTQYRNLKVKRNQKQCGGV